MISVCSSILISVVIIIFFDIFSIFSIFIILPVSTALLTASCCQRSPPMFREGRYTFLPANEMPNYRISKK